MTVEDSEHDNEIERESHPFFFSKMLTNYPCLVVIVINVICYIMLGTLVGFSLLKMSPSSNRDFLIWSDFRVKREDSLVLGKQELDKSLVDGSGFTPVRLLNNFMQTTIIIYEKQNGNNLLTPNDVSFMKTVENDFIAYKNSDYLKFCWAKSSTDSSCNPASGMSGAKFVTNHTTQSVIDSGLNALSYDSVKSFYGKDFLNNSRQSKYSRAIYQMGIPIDYGGVRYKTTIDRVQDQDKAYNTWAHDFYETDIKLYLYSPGLSGYMMQVLAQKDLQFAILSFFFVLIYMIIHTRSLIIPLAGMYQVLLAFPLGYFIYRLVFQITYFSTLHFIVIFLILGIAADDMFVFMDTWEQFSIHEMLRTSLLRRMSITYRSASKAMLVTTLTTTLCFFTTAISEIMPIATFGLFAALVILSNYCLVITHFPAIVILNEKYFDIQINGKNRENETNNNVANNVENNNNNEENINNTTENNNNNNNNAENNNNNNNNNNTENNNNNNNNTENINNNNNEINNNIVNNNINSNNNVVNPTDPQRRTSIRRNSERRNSAQIIRSNSIKERTEKHELKKIEKFFRYKWLNFIYKLRYIIIVLFIVIIALSLYCASQLSPPSEVEEFIPDKINIIKAKLLLKSFHTSTSDNTLKVSFVWGISGVNKDSIKNKYDPEDFGSVIWDSTFDPSSTNAQLRFLDFCYVLGNSSLVLQKVCWVETFKTWVEGQGRTFPVPQTNFSAEMAAFVSPGNSGSALKSSYNIGYISNALKFITIDAYGKTHRFLPEAKQKVEFDKFELIMTSFNAGSGSYMNNAFQTAGFSWQWMASETAFVKNAMQGMLISFSIAFVVLLFSTWNIYISLFAIISIIGTVGSVLAVMKLMDWNLGVIESIACIIVIGFSVDYVVHLETEDKKRYDRTQGALTHMGLSVIGGAITTIGAGLFLFLCTLIFFTKFAILMTTTITFSLCYSLFFFVALVLVIGPQDDQGNLKLMLGKCWNAIKKKKNK